LPGDLCQWFAALNPALAFSMIWRGIRGRTLPVAAVDEYLTDAFKPGMTADALFESYRSFGEDPFVVPDSPADAPVKFSAWDYARQRCSQIAAG
jgi:hypothetical protein